MRQSPGHVIEAASPEAMRTLGAQLARAIEALPSDATVLITLSGDLGSGKTTLVAGVVAALGYAGPVRSPTYTLIEPYRSLRHELYHCDLYRLRQPDELDEIGLLDLRRTGVVLLVEWPERAEGRLGTADLAIEISYRGEGRVLELQAGSEIGQSLATSLSRST